jgi:hypothetical protein
MINETGQPGSDTTRLRDVMAGDLSTASRFAEGNAFNSRPYEHCIRPSSAYSRVWHPGDQVNGSSLACEDTENRAVPVGHSVDPAPVAAGARHDGSGPIRVALLGRKTCLAERAGHNGPQPMLVNILIIAPAGLLDWTPQHVGCRGRRASRRRHATEWSDGWHRTWYSNIRFQKGDRQCECDRDFQSANRIVKSLVGPGARVRDPQGGAQVHSSDHSVATT